MLYDEQTGQPDIKRLAEEEQAAETRAVEEAGQFESLLTHPGYKRLEDWLCTQVEICKEKLIDENDPEMIRRYQQSARAYSNVVGWVREQVQFGKSLKEAAAATQSAEPAAA